MSCHDENIRARLDDWLDGTLTPTRAAEVERHLATCLDCRRESEALRALLRDAAALPAAVEPACDLWRDIAARLTAPPQEHGEQTSVLDRESFPAPATRARGGARRPVHPAWAWSGWLAAAACLAFAFLTYSPRGPAPSESSETILAASLRDFEAGSRQAQAEYAAVLLAAEADARARGEEPLPVVPEIGRSLQTVDLALAKTRAALADDPTNPLLTRLLAAAYAERIGLLRQATRLTGRA